MSYILWHEEWGPLMRVDADRKTARLREGEMAIPCEEGADPGDRERWAREAEEWKARIPTMEELREAKLDELAASRWAAETGGVSVGGMTIRTDRESQGMITGAALQAMIDPEYTCRWKAGEGFVDLDAQTILGAAMAVRAHVQACFDREAELAARAAAASTPKDLEAISWEEKGEVSEDA